MSFQFSLRALVVSSLVLAGCDPKPEPITDPGPPHQVRGSLLLRYRTDQGDASVPQTPTASELQAFALEEGGLRPLEVVTSGDGTFRIPEAPAGKYMLRVGKRYLVTDSRTVNLDTYELGRRDVRTVDKLPQTLASISNFAPDSFYPSINAVSARAGTWANIYLQESLPAGTTSISRSVVNYFQQQPIHQVLLDASKGDTLEVTTFSDRVNEAFVYASVDRAFRQDVSMDPTRPTELQGTFQEVPQKTLTVDWRAADFTAYTTQVHPQATTGNLAFSIYPSEGGTDAWYGHLGELMTTTGLKKVPPQSITFSYGNPLPLRWGELLHFSHHVRTNLRLPGTTLGGMSTFGLSDRRPVTEAAKEPLTVRISPPQQLKVEGKDAHAASTLGSLTPRIDWTAPRLGTPSAYRVLVTRLYTSDVLEDYSLWSIEAFITTTDTSFQLPPGILQPGQTYVFIVTSLLTPGVDLATSMNQIQILTNVAYADVLSGLLTTPASTRAEGMSLAAPRVSEPDAQELLELRRFRHARAH